MYIHKKGIVIFATNIWKIGILTSSEMYGTTYMYIA